MQSTQTTALWSLAERDMSSNIVAFTAYSTESIEYVAGQHFLYSSTITNEGQNFQPSCSFFICPDDGFYLFSINIFSNTNKDVHGAVMIENTILTTAYAERNLDSRTQATALVISQCARHHKVWVRERYGGEAWSDGNRYVSFSGFRLNQGV